MRAFLDDDFLLDDAAAQELYHGTAATLPVFDFHSHLPAGHMAADHRFRSIAEIWLDGDHYKWRAMRANGVPERLITGGASDWERFAAWAATVPATLRNPLYHWTHLELRRTFGIDDLLSPATARAVFERCNERLADPGFSAMGLLRANRVAVVCTTDDPVDTLEHHAALARRPDPDTRVYPTWRPDRAFAIADPAAWNAWVSDLEEAADTSVTTYASLLDALERRHAAFHAAGCRLSDHGLDTLTAPDWTGAEVENALVRIRRGGTLEPAAGAVFQSALLHDLAVLDHTRGWAQQFHIGALRDTNTRLRAKVGRDCGADSIGDGTIARPLARFLDRLDRAGTLAKTVLYNINPADNEVLAAMIGNFQDGSLAGKMQFGSAWWFLDQLDGMRRQMDALSAMGLLSRFVGMVTDSRSFLSYSRHEYFRRLLCGMLGEDVQRGRLPYDRPLLEHLVRAVSYTNARDYFGLRPGRMGGEN